MTDQVSVNVPQAPLARTGSPTTWASAEEIARQITHDLQSNVHYDVPPQAFQYFLGPTMKYSTGVWDAEHNTLDEAQRANLSQITDSLNLTRDSHILDVGCGWGGFPIFAAKRTGCRVTGIALSPKQIEYAKAWAKRENVDHLIDFRVCHVLDLPWPSGTFSHVTFMEVFEHMRLRREVIASCRRTMRDEGILYIQFLGIKSTSYRDEVLYNDGSQHILKIFGEVGDPVPLSTTLVAYEENDFEVLEVRNISSHYPATLYAWIQNIRRNRAAIDELVKPGHADELRKYFMLCLMAYRARLATNHQIWGRLISS